MTQQLVLNIVAGILSGLAVALVSHRKLPAFGAATVVIVITILIPGPIDDIVVASAAGILGFLRIIIRFRRRNLNSFLDS
jgi:hypothetical protein